jgi:hypothetical protein
MHLINVWIVLAILLGLLAVTRLLRYDDVSHYEVFSDGESVGRIAEPEWVAKMPRPAGDWSGLQCVSLADERAAWSTAAGLPNAEGHSPLHGLVHLNNRSRELSRK